MVVPMHLGFFQVSRHSQTLVPSLGSFQDSNGSILVPQLLHQKVHEVASYTGTLQSESLVSHTLHALLTAAAVDALRAKRTQERTKATKLANFITTLDNVWRTANVAVASGRKVHLWAEGGGGGGERQG